MSLLKRNLLASFLGNFWSSIISLLLIPLYINFLGIEAWGVVGIFASLQSICLLLDLGLSITLNRELARLSVREEKRAEMQNLVRTLELIYWVIAVIIGAAVFALAPLIANHWVQANQLSPETIRSALRIMGLAMACQWPFGLYSGGLLGLQRQVLLSSLNAGIATLRGAGALFILWRLSPTLQAFFFWQVIMSLLQTCLAGWFLRQSLPKTATAASVQRNLLRAIWRFAAGISGITVMSVVLTQTDKLILSRLLSLEMFGYYVLAGAVATGIYLFIVPIFSAVYPRFTQLISLGDERALRDLYHNSCQLMSALILSISTVVILFSREILFIWTRNPTTVEHTHLILSFLMMGTALNALMYLPMSLQLAYGWTKLTFYLNVAAVVILSPSIIVMAYLYGAVGAAFTWVICSGGLTLLSIELMHRKVLKGERWRWYVEDVGLPLVVSLGVGLCCLKLASSDGPWFQQVTVLVGVTVFVVGSTLVATPFTRLALIDNFKFWRNRVFGEL